MQVSRRRIALRLQYDGAAFAGSQRQLGQPTVQAALEDAAEALTGAPHRVDFASRTDAGVHATGQVAALTTAAILPLRRWVRGLNHFLPPTVAVQAARETQPDFDPRRWACDRTYQYRVRVAAQRQPLWNSQAWIVRGPLDLPRMQTALQALVGGHDFASFAGASAKRDTVRTMLAAGVEPLRGGLRFEFRAESFLPHQVRRTVGQVVAIGQGRPRPDIIDRLLAEPRPGAAGPGAPPQGLVLVRVRYKVAELEDWESDNEDLFRAPARCTTRLARD